MNNVIGIPPGIGTRLFGFWNENWLWESDSNDEEGIEERKEYRRYQETIMWKVLCSLMAGWVGVSVAAKFQTGQGNWWHILGAFLVIGYGITWVIDLGAKTNQGKQFGGDSSNRSSAKIQGRRSSSKGESPMLPSLPSEQDPIEIIEVDGQNETPSVP